MSGVEKIDGTAAVMGVGDRERDHFPPPREVAHPRKPGRRDAPMRLRRDVDRADPPLGTATDDEVRAADRRHSGEDEVVVAIAVEIACGIHVRALDWTDESRPELVDRDLA